MASASGTGGQHAAWQRGEVAAEPRAGVAGARVTMALKRQRVDKPDKSDLMHQRMANDLDAYGESWLGSSEGSQSRGSPANPWDWVDVSSDCDSESTSGSESTGTELIGMPCGWAAEYHEETGHAARSHGHMIIPKVCDEEAGQAAGQQAAVTSQRLDQGAPVASFSADLKQMLVPIATKLALEMLLDNTYVAGGKRPDHIGSQAEATGRLFKEQVKEFRRVKGGDKWEFKDTRGRQSQIVWEDEGCRGMSQCYGHVQLRTKASSQGPMLEGLKL